MSAPQSASIVLIGARCSGKTSLGRELAARLEREFVDTDELLAKRVGESAEKYLWHVGELAFRVLEAEILKHLAEVRGVVIATGGGAVEQPNFATLARNGRVVFLRAEPATLLARQQAAPRTRLLPGSLADEIAALGLRRNPLYEVFADVTVPVEGPDPILAILCQLSEG